MNGDKSPGDGQASMVQPQSGTVDVEQSPNSSSPGGDSPMDPDWRAQLTLEDRQRIVDQLLETLEKHLSPAQEGDRGLKNIAGRYEEKIFSAATISSRSDYLRKISSTLHALERKSQVPRANSLQNGAADASRISSDSASNTMQSQIHNLGLSMPTVDGESQASQNMENNLSAVSVQNSGSLESTLPAASNLTQDSSLENNSSVAEKSVVKQKLQPGGMQPTIMQAFSLSGLQSSGQQSFQQMPDKQPQSVLVQHQQQPMPQLPVPHQQQTSMAQQPMLQTAQQGQLQPLTEQVSSDGGIQQNQFLPNIQVLRQGLGLTSQQNNNANLQQQHSISHLNNIPNMHQLHLGSGVSSFQQSTIPGMQSISSSEMLNQQQNVPGQQQVQQNVSSLQDQTQQTQAPQPQTVSHVQPQLVQLPRQSNSLQCDVRQKLPTSGAMLQQQNLVAQEKQFSQSQQAIQKASSTQTESSGAVDWQEEVYQKIKSMKDAYMDELNAMYLKIATSFQMQEGLPQPNNQQLSKLKFFKVMLDRLIQFVQISKNDVQKDHQDKLGAVEKQIISVLSSCKPRNPTSLQPGQTSAAEMTQNTPSALLQNISSVPINGSLTTSLQQPSSTFGLEQNSSPLSLQLPQLGMQNSQPQSQISQMPTQSSSPQTSAATMAHNNFGGLHQNTLSSVPSFMFGLGQNSSMFSPQLSLLGIPYSQPQPQISQMQAQPLSLQQTSAATTTQNSFSALNQNMLSSVPSISNPLMNSVSVGLGQNSSLISPQQVAVNSLQQNIALSGPQSSNPVGPLLSSQAGVNAVQPNLNSLSLQNPYPYPQLQQQQLLLQYQQRMQQQLMQQQVLQLHQQRMQQQVMNLQPNAQLPGHPSPHINQQKLVTSLTKTETPLHSANPSAVVTASSTPVAASSKHGGSKKVNASPSPLSKNTTPLQATKAAGSTPTQAPGRYSTTSLTKTRKPSHSADSLDIVPPASTPVAPSPVHSELEKVIASRPSHPDTVTGHIKTPNSAGSSIANTSTGHLEPPNAAGSSVLPLSIFIGDSEIVSANLSSQPNTHVLHLEAPNPSDSSAKPLAISITISIA